MPSQAADSVPISTMKPVRPSERCGVSSAWKKGSSGAMFVSLMGLDYRGAMKEPKQKSTAKSGPRDSCQCEEPAAPEAALLALHAGRD